MYTQVLRSAGLEPRAREELLAEMRDLLDSFLQESLTELGYPSDINTYKAGLTVTLEISAVFCYFWLVLQGDPKLEQFLEEMRQIFKSESENQVDAQGCVK